MIIYSNANPVGSTSVSTHASRDVDVGRFYHACWINVILSPFKRMRPVTESTNRQRCQAESLTKLSPWFSLLDIYFCGIIYDDVHELIETLFNVL